MCVYMCAVCVYLPKFSTSQGNVKVSPTTALYVCPCVINLACDVDDVVASDLLPTKNIKDIDEMLVGVIGMNRKERKKNKTGNLNLIFIDKLSTI